MGGEEGKAKRQNRRENVGDWFRDAAGVGEGKWYQGWGVNDDTGAYTGLFGTGGAGSGGYGGMPAAPDYEAEMEDAEARSAERMEGIYDQIDTIGGMAEDIPSFTEWMEQQGTELNDISAETEGMQDLIDRLSAGPTDEDYDAAYANAARMMGLDPAEAETILGDLTRQMAEGVEGQAGMTEEEMALRRRENQSNMRIAEERARRLVQDTFADSGSTARMMQTADQATMQINNMQIQQDAALAQEDFERSVAQFQSVKAAQQSMLETNQIGVTQYIQNLQQGMGMAIQGYAQKVNAMLAENQQYLQQYTADRDAVLAQIDTLYKAANLELGAVQAELDLTESYYNQNVQPYLDQLNAQLIEDEMGTDWGQVLAGGIQAAAGFVVLGMNPAAGIGMISQGGATATEAL